MDQVDRTLRLQDVMHRVDWPHFQLLPLKNMTIYRI